MSASGLDWKRASAIFSAAWLVFLIFPVLHVISNELPTWQKAVALTLMVAFAACYVLGWQYPASHMSAQERRERLRWFGVLTVLVAAVAGVAGWIAVALTPYLLSYASFTLWQPWRWIISVVIVLGVGGIATFERNALDIFLIDLALLVTSLLLAEFIIRSDAWEKAERDRLVLAERDRIARDVHDLIGHSLTVINLKVQLAERLIETDPTRAKTELSSVRNIASEALSGVRQTVTEVRTATVADEIGNVCDSLASAGIRVKMMGSPESLRGPMAKVAGWILREAATNVVRHAQASNCELRFASNCLVISDDGVGLQGVGQCGLQGMRERVAAAGGSLTLDRSELGGTKVEVKW